MALVTVVSMEPGAERDTLTLSCSHTTDIPHGADEGCSLVDSQTDCKHCDVSLLRESARIINARTW